MNMTPEIKAAIDAHAEAFEKGRLELDAKLEEATKESGEFKDMHAKVVEDVKAKHEEYDEQLKKIKAAMLAAPAVTDPKQQLRKEVVAIAEALKDSASKGVEDMGKFLQSKGLSVADDTRAGQFVRSQFETMIDATITERSIFRQNAQVISISKGDGIERDVNQKGGVGATRDDETESSANEDTGEPSVSEQIIKANWMRASVNVTGQLLDDSAENIANWIQTEAVDDFLTKEDAEWFLGRGTGRSAKEARGILTYPDGTTYGNIEQVSTGSAAALTYDGTVKLKGALKTAYANGAGFFASRDTIYNHLYLLKDGEDRSYLIQDLSRPGALTLLGDPLWEAPQMPSVEANSLSLVYGNFRRGYTIVDRQGLVLLRDPYTAYPKVKFRYGKRVGGDVAVFEAIKILKTEA